MTLLWPSAVEELHVDWLLQTTSQDQISSKLFLQSSTHSPLPPPPQVCSYALGNSSLILFSHLSVESMLFVCVMMRHISMKLLMPFCRSQVSRSTLREGLLYMCSQRTSWTSQRVTVVQVTAYLPMKSQVEMSNINNFQHYRSTCSVNMYVPQYTHFTPPSNFSSTGRDLLSDWHHS